jgi:serine/threonine protein kinase
MATGTDHDFTGETVGNGEYQIGRRLFGGTNSYVYEATRRNGDGKYVFKWIRPVMADAIPCEIKFNQMLRGVPFTVTAEQFITDPAEVYGTAGLIMPRFSGDLYAYVYRSGAVEKNMAIQWSLDLALCLSHLHSMGVVHRDIKPENIFLQDNQAYLGDFGLTEILPPGEMFWDAVGTEQYYAPELFLHDPYDQSVDMWDFGVILYIIFTGKWPFEWNSKNRQPCIDAILRAAYDRGPLWNSCTEPMRQLVENLLVVNPERRWTCADVLGCALYRDVESDEIQGQSSSVIGSVMDDADQT